MPATIALSHKFCCYYLTKILAPIRTWLVKAKSRGVTMHFLNNSLQGSIEKWRWPLHDGVALRIFKPTVQTVLTFIGKTLAIPFLPGTLWCNYCIIISVILQWFGVMSFECTNLPKLAFTKLFQELQVFPRELHHRVVLLPQHLRVGHRIQIVTGHTLDVGDVWNGVIGPWTCQGHGGVDPVNVWSPGRWRWRRNVDDDGGFRHVGYSVLARSISVWKDGGASHWI